MSYGRALRSSYVYFVILLHGFSESKYLYFLQNGDLATPRYEIVLERSFFNQRLGLSLNRWHVDYAIFINSAFPGIERSSLQELSLS